MSPKKANLEEMGKELNGIIKPRSIKITLRLIIILCVIVLLFAFAVIFSYQREELRAKRLISIKISLSENIAYKVQKVSYRAISRAVEQCMGVEHPLIILAIASRSGYVQSWSRAGAVGMCAVPVIYQGDLKSSKVILHSKDLFDFDVSIKASEFVWNTVWEESDGDIDKALGLYFKNDDPKQIKNVMDRYWKFVYLVRRPQETYNVE